MDDLTAFERQITAELGQMAGPGRRVDVAAMVRNVSTQPPKWRFPTMVSATKLVVAGAIVALLGGALVIAQPFTRPAAPPGAAPTEPGAFSPTGSLVLPRAEHTATLLPDGRVLVVGGFDVREEGTNTAEIWDPVTDTFGPTGSLAQPRAGHSATLLPDGRVLVVGGGGDEEDTEDFAFAEVWDPSTGAFSPAGSTAMRWADLVTLLPDGRVLVVGGGGGEDLALEEFALAEVWDPATSTFSAVGLVVPDYFGATALADGRVLFLGEYSTSDENPPSAKVWDPATSTFSPAGSSTLLEINSATLLADGRVLVVGGRDHTPGVHDSAEVWDPATSTFSPAGLLTTQIGHYRTTTALLDGRVLIVAGCPQHICDSAEVWDPATSTFSPTSSLAEPRLNHTTTTLADGRVLVVGGRGSWGGNVHASAEVWYPSDG